MANRKILYMPQILRDTDLLQMERNSMIAVSKLAEALIGTSTVVSGLACTPTSPASLQVAISAGQIYQMASVDDNAFGSLAPDTSSILQQGILDVASMMTCPAPVTSGFSITYLIQAQFQSQDGGSTVLPYYNAANPSVQYSGPSNSGAAQNTDRIGTCVVSVKAGTAATTGTQTAPAPDAGYVGLWAVTVANGATTITSDNIAAATGAPRQSVMDPTSFATAAQGTKADAALPATSQAADSAKLGGSLPSTFLNISSWTGANQSLTADRGYQKLPGGLILQWGTTTNFTSESTQSINFPVVFPNSCLNVTATAKLTGAFGPYNDQFIQIVSFDASTVVLGAQEVAGSTTWPLQATWFALGY